jgi:hypothetical protein
MNNDCWRCDQLMAALHDEDDLSRVEAAFPGEVAAVVAHIHLHNHLALERPHVR